MLFDWLRQNNQLNFVRCDRAMWTGWLWWITSKNGKIQMKGKKHFHTNTPFGMANSKSNNKNDRTHCVHMLCAYIKFFFSFLFLSIWNLIYLYQCSLFIGVHYHDNLRVVGGYISRYKHNQLNTTFELVLLLLLLFFGTAASSMLQLFPLLRHRDTHQFTKNQPA